ncbi:HAD-IA family hydrolase [Leucobacter ruminantium]|uniref:HAD-IA family hydrolase n=1 Tax=Leucobacter ruminantium TaxID=1289170 RepID=A0A939M038_9MICO|nr:HAD-IA family hydrolase [Leucobacter ruminantium]
MVNTLPTERTPAAVLWDMDGTLIDSEPLWLEAEVAMLARYGIEMTTELRDRIVGSGLRTSAQLFRDLGVRLTVDEIIDEWATSVIAGLLATRPDWRPGAVELLQSLRDAGVPCVLVTMSVRGIADTVVRLLPEGMFSGVIAGDEVAHEKPHPDPYLRGAALAGVPIEACLAIEDSVTGLNSAFASGAVTVGVPNLLDLSDAPKHELWPTLAGVDAAQIAEAFARHADPSRAADPSPETAAGPENAPEPASRNAPEPAPALSGPLGYGDRVQLTGPKGRLNTITLVEGGEFHSHRGMIRHAEIVGLPDGSVVANSSGEEYLALRPLLSDFVMSMPRGAAIVYPKDAAQIVSLADIFPGARVVEAGVGSGALSLHLLRAIGPAGELFSFERREEFAEIARANAAAFSGSTPDNWTVTVGDLQETLPAACEPGSVDRVVLDMLAPWECVDAAAEALKPGGVLICYVATVTQLSRTAEQIRRSGAYTHPQSSETMVRGWHVEGLAVRPDHRMVAHTGFLLTARRLAPGAVLPDLKRRASKSDFTDADLASWLPDLGGADASEVWKPEAVGERGKSEKVLRKKAREARRIAEQRERGGSADG